MEAQRVPSICESAGGKNSKETIGAGMRSPLTQREQQMIAIHLDALQLAAFHAGPLQPLLQHVLRLVPSSPEPLVVLDDDDPPTSSQNARRFSQRDSGPLRGRQHMIEGHGV